MPMAACLHARVLAVRSSKRRAALRRCCVTKLLPLGQSAHRVMWAQAVGLFSATLPQLVEQLAAPFLDRHVRITVGERACLVAVRGSAQAQLCGAKPLRKLPHCSLLAAATMHARKHGRPHQCVMHSAC